MKPVHAVGDLVNVIGAGRKMTGYIKGHALRADNSLMHYQVCYWVGDTEYDTDCWPYELEKSPIVETVDTLVQL